MHYLCICKPMVYKEVCLRCVVIRYFPHADFYVSFTDAVWHFFVIRICCVVCFLRDIGQKFTSCTSGRCLCWVVGLCSQWCVHSIYDMISIQKYSRAYNSTTYLQHLNTSTTNIQFRTFNSVSLGSIRSFDATSTQETPSPMLITTRH